MTAGSYHRSIEARVIVPGEAEGEALVSPEPLSFWGGYDPATGEIMDRRHPLSGQSAAGKVLLLPFTRGSSTTSAILLESVRAGTAPAAIVSRGTGDAFLALASIVADEMYEAPIPIFAVAPDEFALFRTGQRLALDPSGAIHIKTEN